MDSTGDVEYVVRCETTPPDNVEGTAFAHLDVRTLVGADRQGSTRVMVGQTIYPALGGTHEHHLHPDAEEVVIVTDGSGWHRVGDRVFRIRAGDVVFVPRNTAHSAGADGPEQMRILWILGGAASLEMAGYVSVPEITTATS